MRTGRYRLRRGLCNSAILQEEFSEPTYIGGHVDASLRQITWQDVPFDKLDTIRVALLRPTTTDGTA
jgi:hypothetical protein